MFLNAPITGYGPHTFMNYYNSSVAKLDLPPDLPIDTRVVPWAHNLYLEILAERGLFVFLAFIALITLTLVYSFKAIKNHQSGLNCLACGALAAFSGFLIGAFFEFTFLRLWVIIILYSSLGCSVGLWMYVPRKSPETVAADETQIS